MKKINTIDNGRRALLKTFAASGISKALISSSPLVAGMLYSRHADAQSDGTPNKSVVIYVPGGAIHDFWAPTGEGANMQLGSMSAGYEDVKTECNFLRNMTHTSGGHGLTQLILSSGFTGDSYDVAMGQALGPDRPFQYINLGVHSNGHGTLTRQGNSAVPFQDNPFNAFNLFFGEGASMGGNGGQDATTSVLDAHAAAANAIRTKLAGYEVERVDQHLDAISDTQRRLADLSSNSDGGGSVGCAAAPNASEFALNFENFTRQAELQADIIVAALSCGLTSSASLAFGNHQSEFSLPGLNFTGLYHNSIHGGSNGQANYPFYVEMRARLGEYSAYVIDRLRAQGILDSTVVVETTDMGHADLHSRDDVPMMIAGGGSAINRGTSIVGTKPSNGQPSNQQDLLHTAAQACGVDIGFGEIIPGVLS